MEEALPLTDRLNLETARITWPELERHFAAGRVIHVVAALDLIEVAAGFAADNSKVVQQWLSTQQICQLSDDTARDWMSRQTELWAVVVAPWVLVQERAEA